MLSKLHSFVCFQTHFICINDALTSITLVCSCFFKFSLCYKLRCMMLDFHRNLQITDRTILDKQIIHETLYKFWKDECIDSEVCCTNSTHVAFLAWTSWSCCFKIVFSWRNNSYCNVFALYHYFNDVKGVDWFSMSFDRADFHITSKMIWDLSIQGDAGFSGSEEAEKMPWPRVQQPSAEVVWVPWTSHCISKRLISVNVAWKLNF